MKNETIELASQVNAYHVRKALNDALGVPTEAFKYVPPGQEISYPEFIAQLRAKKAAQA